jgi:hypothetical protein
MTTTTIVLALAALVLLSIGIIVVTQLREKARIEKARKATALEGAYQLTQRLLDELPPQYLTSELKQIILRRAEDVCDQLKPLGSQLPVSQWQADITARRQAMADEADKKPTVRIETPGQAGEIKQLLQAQFRMIEAMMRSRAIANQLAKKYLKQTLFLINKTQADLHAHEARELSRQNEIRKAIHAYHLASTEMGKSPDHPTALKAIKSYRTRIHELESQLEENVDSATAEEKRRLEKEWDHFLEEDDDDWKKKADYD